jgi:S-DNA-T family DNA segregation ATPase FtsK/SpoIIIE
MGWLGTECARAHPIVLAGRVDSSGRRTVAVPRPPEVSPPHRFPIVAILAPLAVSAILFAVTRSAFTLVFAALGPVVAVASVVDARILRARTLRRERAGFESDVAAARLGIDEAHRAERAERRHRLPGTPQLVDSPALVAARWRRDPVDELSLRIGCADLDSELVVESGGDSPAIAELRQRASLLERAPAPIRIAAGAGIGIVGSPVACAAVARGLALQLAASLSPATWSIAVAAGPPEESGWIDRLPHARIPAGGDYSIEFRSGGHSFAIAIARHASALPAGLGLQLEVSAGATAVVEGRPIAVDFVSAGHADELAGRLDTLATRLGVATGRASEPDLVEFAALAPVGDDSTLSAALGATGSAPVVLDLVRQGPHAVIGGTTGSGKSELLLSWVLGMAACRSPSLVTFLFVDFKGGASFGSLVDLPHSVGVLTDLDAAQSERALASLAAELRHRERELAAAGLRSIDDAESPPFPRLVVVVDEFAAVVDTFPALHGAFADIAARGRSLGVHLVLCTQRPSGVVRDSILANCPLRVSLRVTSPADSAALLGTDAAASLPAFPRGRALVSAAGEPPVAFQVARSISADVARVAARWAECARPRAPWLPQLPSTIPPAVVTAMEPGAPDSSLPFAVADLPGEQTQRVVRYSPREHGSLLVLGAGRSGRSGVLAALEAAPTTLEVVRVPSGIASAWDLLTGALNAGEQQARLLLLDDVDVAIAGCPDGYQDAFVDVLARVLREGPAVDTWLAVAAQRASGHLSGLAALCGTRLVLRMADRAEHALAGADTAFAANLPPGGGFWRTARIQVVLAEPSANSSIRPHFIVVDPATAWFAVVSTRPEAMASLLRAQAPGRSVQILAPTAFGASRDELEVSRGGAPAILVADPDTWQSQWSAFAAMQRSGDILFDGCSLAEFRALTRSRELPPPFDRGERPLWRRTADGEVGRARLSTG